MLATKSRPLIRVAISDATAHFDPADLRGLGPSRTLVLVNGKEKIKVL
jgi:outer membrane receptor for ferrienterochelin and colicin